MKTITSMSLSNSVRAALAAIATDGGVGGETPNISATMESLVANEVARRRRHEPAKWAAISDAIAADLALTTSGR